MKTAIVLGVGRCGSSMVAGMMHKMGIPMGKVFIAPNKYNQSGYWEDATIMGIQNKMLASIGRSWWNPPQDERELDRVMVNYIYQMESLIDKRNEQKVSWGWKDPRTHFLINLYKHKLINPRYIVVHRNPLSIADSIMTRDKQIDTLAKALEIVNKQYTQLFEMCLYGKLGGKQLHLKYEEIIEDPTTSIEGLSRFLDIELPDSKISEISEFIDPYLKTW